MNNESIITSYKIIANRQKNGLWGGPINLFAVDKLAPLDYRWNLQNAIVTAVNEIHNTPFRIGLSDDDGFVIYFTKPVDLPGCKKFLPVTYDNYFLINKTLYYMNKGDLMKIAYEGETTNVDSSIDRVKADDLRDRGIDPRWYVQQYGKDDGAFGKTVNLFEKIGLRIIERHDNPNWEDLKMVEENRISINNLSEKHSSLYEIIIRFPNAATRKIYVNKFEIDDLCNLLNSIKYGI